LDWTVAAYTGRGSYDGMPLRMGAFGEYQLRIGGSTGLGHTTM